MATKSKIARFCWKTNKGSFNGGCPAMYDATDSGWVVQGMIVPGRPGTLWVDADVIDPRGLDVTVLPSIERGPEVAILLPATWWMTHPGQLPQPGRQRACRARPGPRAGAGLMTGTAITPAEFDQLLAGAQASLLRWEAQPEYAVTVEAHDFELFAAGRPGLRRSWSGGGRGWTRSPPRHGRGVTVERVAVDDDPATLYQQWRQWAAWLTQRGR